MNLQVSINECACISKVGTPTCSDDCFRKRKNLRSKMSRLRGNEKKEAPQERICVNCAKQVHPKRAKFGATTCGLPICTTGRKRLWEMNKKNIENLRTYIKYLEEEVLCDAYVFYTLLEPQHLDKIQEVCMTEAINILICRLKNYHHTQSDYANREELQNLLTTLRENMDMEDLQDLVELDLRQVQAAGMTVLNQIIAQLKEMVTGKVYFQFSIPMTPYHRMLRRQLPQEQQN